MKYMKMKSILSALAVFCCMAMTACGGTAVSSTAPTPDTPPAPATEAPPAPAEENPPEVENAPADAPDEVPAEDDSWEKIQEKGELVMGLSSSYPPSSFIDESGEIVGFEIDFAGEVCKRLGINLVKHEITWEEKEDDLALGEIDCIWSAMSMTPEREKSMCLSDPYMKVDIVFIVDPASGVETIEDMAGKTVSVPDSSTSKDLLEAEYPEIYITSMEDNSDVLRQLELGLVDAACMDSGVANYWNASNGGIYNILLAKEANENYAIGFRKSDVALRNKIQETINEMVADGTFTEISMKWFGTDVYADLNGTAVDSGEEGETPDDEDTDSSDTETAEDGAESDEITE